MEKIQKIHPSNQFLTCFPQKMVPFCFVSWRLPAHLPNVFVWFLDHLKTRFGSLEEWSLEKSMGKLESIELSGPPPFFPMVRTFGWCIYGCFYKNRGKTPPKWMVKIMENPIKMDDFRGTTIFGNPPYIIFSFFGGIILPNYIGITINHYKDPY